MNYFMKNSTKQDSRFYLQGHLVITVGLMWVNSLDVVRILTPEVEDIIQ